MEGELVASPFLRNDTFARDCDQSERAKAHTATSDQHNNFRYRVPHGPAL